MVLPNIHAADMHALDTRLVGNGADDISGLDSMYRPYFDAKSFHWARGGSVACARGGCFAQARGFIAWTRGLIARARGLVAGPAGGFDWRRRVRRARSVRRMRLRRPLRFAHQQ